MSNQSPRELVAEHLAETCRFAGLDEVYGVQKARATDRNGKTYWAVTFCKAKILDGMIKVYSPRFILIKWVTAMRNLPREGWQKCDNEDIAKNFMANFIE